ncbi:hypothetical protein BT93_B0596 [Corymbia citriodora subsp. variegata]|nr:hypothetical protein BT93_B0596 [Corymbia citriodora subsp. variegata]
MEKQSLFDGPLCSNSSLLRSPKFATTSSAFQGVVLAEQRSNCYALCLIFF